MHVQNVYVCVYEHVCACACVCISVSMYVYACVYLCVMCTHLHVFMWRCAHVHFPWFS
jgi:hypothetical protein